MLLGRGRGAVGVEGRVLDAVAVDFADVEVLFYFGDVAGGDAVGCAPDSGWCGGVLEWTLLLDLPTDHSVSVAFGWSLT